MVYDVCVVWLWCGVWFRVRLAFVVVLCCFDFVWLCLHWYVMAFVIGHDTHMGGGPCTLPLVQTHKAQRWSGVVMPWSCVALSLSLVLCCFEFVPGLVLL